RRWWECVPAAPGRHRAPGLRAGCRRRLAAPCRHGWIGISYQVLHAQARNVGMHESQDADALQCAVYIALTRLVRQENDVGFGIAMRFLEHGSYGNAHVGEYTRNVGQYAGTVLDPQAQIIRGTDFLDGKYGRVVQRI